MSENNKNRWDNIPEESANKAKTPEEKVSEDILPVQQPIEEQFVTEQKIETSRTKNVNAIITGQIKNNAILFIGPREVGKTVALLRLAHYIKGQKKCSIAPNRAYRKDEEYEASVNAFLDDLHNPNFNPKRTGNIDFLVLDVFKDATLHCQFLEAPGEAYFDEEKPHSTSFPPYIFDILGDSTLNKVFVFFFEDGMLLKSKPAAYSAKLTQLTNMMDRKRDDVIIVYNKSDKLRHLYKRNRPNLKEFKNLLYNDSNYSDFISSLKKLGIPVKYVAFSSGTFHTIADKIENGRKVERWVHSDDEYPKTLWKAIERCFSGFSFWG